MKNKLFSQSSLEIKEQRNAVAHVISNKKLLNMYHPMDVKDSLALYLKEMLSGGEGKDENR